MAIPNLNAPSDPFSGCWHELCRRDGQSCYSNSLPKKLSVAYSAVSPATCSRDEILGSVADLIVGAEAEMMCRTMVVVLRAF